MNPGSLKAIEIVGRCSKSAIVLPALGLVIVIGIYPMG
jgi:hypothetical protein